MPAKLAARVRAFDTGQGNKTDATVAHAVVIVALRTRGLRQLIVYEELAVLQAPIALAPLIDPNVHSAARSARTASGSCPTPSPGCIRSA